MRRFVIWFASIAPLLIWLAATFAFIVTARIWLSFPTCVIDDAALLTWVYVLPIVCCCGVASGRSGFSAIRTIHLA
jgi:hypothetical protein